jgi:hypothetical protein
LTRGAKLVIVTIIALAIVVAVFAALNREYTSPNREAQLSGNFYIYAGEEAYTVTLDSFEDLLPFDIDANYKTSGRVAETRMYRGVSLKSVIEGLGIDISAYKRVVFNGADGYASALKVDDAMDDGNCYIVNEMGGVPLGSIESGGTGPFMMILAHDRFSFRWCKYLMDIKLV